MDWTEKVSVRNEKWVDRKSFSIEILQALFLKLTWEELGFTLALLFGNYKNISLSITGASYTRVTQIM